MAIKFKNARFTFVERDESIIVTFYDDEITVLRAGKYKVLKNRPAKRGGRPYKPRVADCLRAIADAQPRERIKPLAIARQG